MCNNCCFQTCRNPPPMLTARFEKGRGFSTPKSPDVSDWVSNCGSNWVVFCIGGRTFSDPEPIVFAPHQLQVGLVEVSGNSVTKKKPGGLRMPKRLPYAPNIFFYNTWAPPGLCKRPHVKIFSEFRDQFTYFWIFFEKLGQIFDRNPKIKFEK